MERKHHFTSTIPMQQKRKIEIMSCTGCGFCKEGCPVFENTGIESSSGKGKILLAYGLLQGDIKENESINRAFYECSLCKKCETRCPSLIDIPLIISSMRKFPHLEIDIFAGVCNNCRVFFISLIRYYVLKKIWIIIKRRLASSTTLFNNLGYIG